MPTAARLPSPTLSIIRRGPKTQSPPAKIPEAEVISVCGLTAIRPRGDSSTLSSGVRKSRRGACPIAMMMVSHSIWRFAVFEERRIEALVLIEDPLGLERLERNDLAILAQDPLRARARGA